MLYNINSGNLFKKSVPAATGTLQIIPYYLLGQLLKHYRLESVPGIAIVQPNLNQSRTEVGPK